MRAVVCGATLVLVTSTTLALLLSTTACGGCPRARGGAHGAHPAATDVAAIEPIEVEAVAGPPIRDELDAATVRAVAASQTADVRRCFEAARAEHPALAGVVELELAIDDGGAVRTASVASNETGDGVLSACIAALALHWHFPTSPHGARVRVPFEGTEPPPAPQAATAAGLDAGDATPAAEASE